MPATSRSYWLGETMNTRSIAVMSLIILGAMIGTVLIVNNNAIAQINNADVQSKQATNPTQTIPGQTTTPANSFDAWEVRAPMPTGRDLAAAVVVNDEILGWGVPPCRRGRRADVVV